MKVIEITAEEHNAILEIVDRLRIAEIARVAAEDAHLAVRQEYTDAANLLNQKYGIEKGSWISDDYKFLVNMHA